MTIDRQSGDARVRVRSAPSPTGYFHVGNARTALYNWFFARQSGGTFILRIEDTDRERDREAWVDGIVSALGWLGLDWDEGPVRQSERGELYREAVRDLDTAGAVYWCDCTREEIEARRLPHAPPGYDGHCRDRGLGPGLGRALRFAVPRAGVTVIEDVVRGTVNFENSSLEDFVLVKSSGAPLFVLANVVDDMAMGITHVIRGEDLLPSTPKGVLVWQALDAARDRSDGGLPVFAHLPMLVNDRRQKLSKRRDEVAVENYRERGYLAPAMVNYLALLGWSPPHGREIMDLEEMVPSFNLASVNNSPAFFDTVKLTHFNEEYIRSMTPSAFVEASRPWLDNGPWPRDAFRPAVFERIAPLVQERVRVLSEVPAWVDFLFLEHPVTDMADWAKAVSGDGEAEAVLRAASLAYASCDWEAVAIKSATTDLGKKLGLNLKKTQAPIRVAVTGRSVGPPLFESLELLGRDRVLERIHSALDRLSAEVR